MGVPGTFHYSKCDRCSTVYQNPRVRDEDLLLCYPSRYFTHQGIASPLGKQTAVAGSVRARVRQAVLAAADGGQVTSLTKWWARLGRVLSLIPRVRRRARYGLIDELAPPTRDRPTCLEVGPGRGDTLLHLRQAGWVAHGLDIDPEAAAIASKVSGCEVRVGRLGEEGFHSGSFDLVYLHHVMEHMPNLEVSLSRCFELLTSLGRLVIIYPNPEALTVKFYSSLSCVWDPPRHLVLPPIGAMRHMLCLLGFPTVRCRSTAWRAGAYHKTSRSYRAGRPQQAFDAAPLSVLDRVFALTEAALVVAGIPVGEEILVVADRR